MPRDFKMWMPRVRSPSHSMSRSMIHVSATDDMATKVCSSGPPPSMRLVIMVVTPSRRSRSTMRASIDWICDGVPAGEKPETGSKMTTLGRNAATASRTSMMWRSMP